MKKILVIRFSSIGDIVLTTPVVRCLKKQLPESEIHFAVKKQNKSLLDNNPYIDKIHCLEDSFSHLIRQLKAEKFDHIIDLHNSLRSALLKIQLGIPSGSFPKLNIEKWLLVNLKINRLPTQHIVDRYIMAAKKLNITNDGNGLDYFIPDEDAFNPFWFPSLPDSEFIAWAIGGKHQTKIFPAEKIVEVCQLLQHPVILLGGTEDKSNAETIANLFPGKVWNTAGTLSVNRSAAVIKQSKVVITNDTGMMHISAAFQKKIISIWGNTVPEFGMYPYLPEGDEQKSVIIENRGLHCRPCSKIGFDACPKKHFDCMNRLDSAQIAEIANKLMESPD